MLDWDTDKGLIEGPDKDKGLQGGLDKDKGLNKDKESGQDSCIDNLDDRMTKDQPVITGTTAVDVLGTTTAVTTAAAIAATTTTAATTAIAVTAVTTIASAPLSSDVDKSSNQDQSSDKDVLLAPLDASLSSVDLLMLAGAGKNNRSDLRGLGSGNLYLSSSSEFERGMEGTISEGIRSLEDSGEFEYSLPAPPVKSSSQTASSQSNLISDDLDVESYLFDPVVQHLWSRLCHVREEMAKYGQQ